MDAVSFLGSAFFLRRIDPVEPPADPAGGGVTEGLRFIAHSPIVRASLTGLAVVNLFNLMYYALFMNQLRDTALRRAPRRADRGDGRTAARVVGRGGRGVVGAAVLVPSPLPRFRLPG